jgi:signal transduction histidine kinase
LQQNPKLDEDSRKYVEQIEAELERLRYIITQTLTRYGQSASPAPVAVVQVLDTVLRVYKDQIASKNVQVEKRYDCDARVMADFEDLPQVFANLIVNAVQALQPMGKLAIHVRRRHGGSVAETLGVRVVISERSGYSTRAPKQNLPTVLQDQRPTRQRNWPSGDLQNSSGARRRY